MSGATDAQAALRDAMPAQASKPLDISAFAEQLDAALGLAAVAEQITKRVTGANDIEAGMRHALDALLASDAAAAAFQTRAEDMQAHEQFWKARSKAIRAALAKAFTDTGAAKVRAETHSASPTKAKKRLVIKQPKLLPMDVMDTSPRPNDQIIKARLVGGIDVPGACLEDGEPGIQVTLNK